MQLQQRTENKQHILAEDNLGNQLIPSLSNLFITHYEDCNVLAAFSCIEKKLLAYKITHPIDNLEESEPWLTLDFNQITTVSFTHLFETTPQLFSNNSFKGQNLVNNILVSHETEKPKDTLHYTAALINYHLTKKLHNQIYLFKKEEHYSILLMNSEACLLANTFECKNENEVLYFLLNTLQISDILPSETTMNIDYSLTNNQSLIQFLSPHIANTEILRYSFAGLNTSIPQLPEKLFGCHAASLCV